MRPGGSVEYENISLCIPEVSALCASKYSIRYLRVLRYSRTDYPSLASGESWATFVLPLCVGVCVSVAVDATAVVSRIVSVHILAVSRD